MVDNEILCKLRVLSQLEPNQKPYFYGNKIYIREPSWLSSIKRFFNGEGRDVLCEDLTNFFENILVRARNMVFNYEHGDPGSKEEITREARILCVKINEACRGLEVLKSTYSEDPTRSALETIKDNSAKKIIALLNDKVLKSNPVSVIDAVHERPDNDDV